MQLDRSLIIVFEDVIYHMAFGIFVNLPIIVKQPINVVTAIVFSVLLDTDHVIQARSFSVKKMINLGERPAFHSLLIVILITVIVHISFRSMFFSATALLSMLSHLIWDLATGGVHLLFPIKKLYKLTKLQAVFAFIMLFGISFFLL